MALFFRQRLMPAWAPAGNSKNENMTRAAEIFLM
jgi:hypothetical protein